MDLAAILGTECAHRPTCQSLLIHLQPTGSCGATSENNIEVASISWAGLCVLQCPHLSVGRKWPGHVWPHPFKRPTDPSTALQVQLLHVCFFLVNTFQIMSIHLHGDERSINMSVQPTPLMDCQSVAVRLFVYAALNLEWALIHIRWIQLSSANKYCNRLCVLICPDS